MRGAKQLAALAVFTTAAQSAAQDLAGTCTILDAPGGATVDGDPLRVGDPIDPGATVALPGQGQMVIRLSDSAAQAVVYLDPASAIAIGSPAGPRRAVTVQSGSVVVHYAATDEEPLVIVTAAGWARLYGGTLLVVAGDRSVFLLAQGRGVVFAGVLPAPPPPDDAGTRLDPEGNNQAFVTRGQAQVETGARPTALPEMQGRMNRAHATALRAARAGWLRRAVSGDIVPAVAAGQPVGAVVGALAADSSVTQPTVVTAVTTPPVTTGAVAPLTATAGRAQTLLESGDAASVVVGARLQRTRIVGNPGTAGGGVGTGVRFNPEVRAPLRLSSTLQRR